MDLIIPYVLSSDWKVAYREAKKLLESATFEKWGIEAEIKAILKLKEIKAEGRGFTLLIKFEKSNCHAHLNLSSILRPLRRKILSEIENELRKII